MDSKSLLEAHSIHLYVWKNEKQMIIFIKIINVPLIKQLESFSFPRLRGSGGTIAISNFGI